MQGRVGGQQSSCGAAGAARDGHLVRRWLGREGGSSGGSFVGHSLQPPINLCPSVPPHHSLSPLHPPFHCRYYSPYPEPHASCQKLYICEYTLKVGSIQKGQIV